MVTERQMKNLRIQDKALELSSFTDGSGIEILEIASLALTDINYHPEAKILMQMAELIDNGYYPASLEELARHHLDE